MQVSASLQVAQEFQSTAGARLGTNPCRGTLGRGSGPGRQPAEAEAAFSTAVGLLPLLAWHGLDRATQEHWLADAHLATDAAATAIAANHPEHASSCLSMAAAA